MALSMLNTPFQIELTRRRATAIATINPATGEVLATFDPLSEVEIEERLSLAAHTFRYFRNTSFRERSAILLRLADVLVAEQDHFSRLITTEMGKPIREARAEIEKSVKLCRYYAAEGERLLVDRYPLNDSHESYIRFEPLGAVLAVMPWNFPFWQVIRMAAPALMAGNVVLLKHSPNVPQCALSLETLFRRAGLLKGGFQTLLIGSSRVANLIADPRVAAVSLTGGERAGSAVGALAGKYIKKSVLELGGNDPFIVMPSANLDKAIKTAVKARTVNAGQSCTAAKRFIIAEEIYDEFQSRFVEGMKRLHIGDPLDEATELGPLASEAALNRLELQVKECVSAGARLLLGGSRLRRPGFYFAPSVITDIPLHTPACREEFFGPVAQLFRVRNINEAIKLANDTSFGLGASVWTNNQEECERFVREIEAGSVFVNDMVASDQRFPFGGVKRSGYGRELGAEGLREFVNIKTIRIQDWTPAMDINSSRVGLSLERPSKQAISI